MSFDTAAQTWGYTANWYDAANRLTYQDTIYDDGSAVETGYNVGGVASSESASRAIDKIVLPKVGYSSIPEAVTYKEHNLSPRLRDVKLAA